MGVSQQPNDPSLWSAACLAVSELRFNPNRSRCKTPALRQGARQRPGGDRTSSKTDLCATPKEPQIARLVRKTADVFFGIQPKCPAGSSMVFQPSIGGGCRRNGPRVAKGTQRRSSILSQRHHVPKSPDQCKARARPASPSSLPSLPEIYAGDAAEPSRQPTAPRLLIKILGGRTPSVK